MYNTGSSACAGNKFPYVPLKDSLDSGFLEKIIVKIL